MVTYSFQDYVRRLLSLIGDGANKLNTAEEGDIDELIKQAVVIYSKQRPHFIRYSVESTGESEYLLSEIIGDLWTPGVSRIERIEYPTGNIPPTYLNESDYYIYDDGSEQNSDNRKLIFLSPPSAGQNFIIEFIQEMSLTREGGQNFDHNSFDFSAICYKAAELCFQTLASKFAQTFDATISADSVNYSNLTQKYISLADEMRKQYNRLVFGEEEPAQELKGAIIDVNVEPKASDRKNYLFH